MVVTFPRALFALPTAALFAALFVASMGCTSVRSSAHRFDGAASPVHEGEVAIYGVGLPSDVRMMGAVDVEALGDEANIETLIPVFKQRVAGLGATGGVIDNVVTSYQIVTGIRTSTYTYPCGRSMCSGVRSTPYSYEVRKLTLHGRAVVPAPTFAAPPPPAPAPAAPETP